MLTMYYSMIWLSGKGGFVTIYTAIFIAIDTVHYSIQPVGSQITTATPVAGHTWNLWKGKHRSIFRPDSVLKCVRYVGPNSNWEVFSFVSSTGDLTDFSADLKDFFGALCTLSRHLQY